MQVLGKVLRRTRAFVYRRHVGLVFPTAMIRAHRPAAPPDGYVAKQPPDAADVLAIAALLNEEPGFGDWTPQRVAGELLANLASPKSATLVLHGDTLVGLGFATDASHRRRRVAHGMYLYVAPAHRRRGSVGTFIVFDVFQHCVDAGYDHIHAYTDPTRLPAIRLYLSYGAKPLYDSLSSIWHWRRILRELGPIGETRKSPARDA